MKSELESLRDKLRRDVLWVKRNFSQHGEHEKAYVGGFVDGIESSIAVVNERISKKRKR